MLMLRYILLAWFVSTIISTILAVTIGSLVGVIVGAIKKRMRKTIFPSILGSFVGVMWICMIPLYASPGIMQGWGMGGGLGSLAPMLGVITLGPTGALTGGITGSTVGFRFVQTLSVKRLVAMMGIVYLVVAASILMVFSVVCINSQPHDWYCHRVGF